MSKELIEALEAAARICGGCGTPEYVLLKDAIAIIKQHTPQGQPVSDITKPAIVETGENLQQAPQEQTSDVVELIQRRIADVCDSPHHYIPFSRRMMIARAIAAMNIGSQHLQSASKLNVSPATPVRNQAEGERTSREVLPIGWPEFIRTLQLGKESLDIHFAFKEYASNVKIHGADWTYWPVLETVYKALISKGILPPKPVNQAEVEQPDDKNAIIKLQQQRIESLEQAIGLAKDDYYDKVRDGDLWEHPLMANLMAVLKEGGHTPISKDTQICLVKAALRSMPNPVNQAEGECIESGEEYAVEPYKAFFDALWIAYCNQDLQFEDMDFIITAACKNGLVKEEKYNPDIHGEALGNEWGLENGDSCYVLGKKPTPKPVKVSVKDLARAMMRTVFHEIDVETASLDWTGNDVWGCDFAEMTTAILDELIKQGVNIRYD